MIASESSESSFLGIVVSCLDLFCDARAGTHEADDSIRAQTEIREQRNRECKPVVMFMMYRYVL